ncbi:uncharacterized protein LOC142326311 isoform X1 [Lycorma delicatula]|uniref:uncharacterized protein LOC142326311 isoform X1 n=1 Tax=Lycorma delicatula TaxID=130591 RepID=UPI003F50E3A0
MLDRDVGPPKLKEFSCHMKVVDRTTAIKPVCVLNFVLNKTQVVDRITEQIVQAEKTEDTLTNDNIETVTLEMESSTLDTLLEGLHRIQQQLSASASSISST